MLARRSCGVKGAALRGGAPLASHLPAPRHHSRLWH